MRMNLLEEIRFKLDSARRAHGLHEQITSLKKSNAALRSEIEHSEFLETEAQRRKIVDLFHKLYYEQSKRTWQNTRWMGTRVMKTPFDLWVYQEMIHEMRPDVIIETGTALGGSALYFAHLFDLMEKGRIVTIDLEEREGNPVPPHDRIMYLRGSSVAAEVVERVRMETEDAEDVVVILDSDHSKDHVLAELKTYAPFVTGGSYLIVEDTNVNGRPVLPDFGEGPAEAIEEFLGTGEGRNFEVDPSREKFYFTFNSGGFLKRS